MAKKKIIYIMGAGRSGSTILGILLGNLNKVFYAGELYSWPKFEGNPNSDKKNTISFWTPIRKNILEKHNIPKVKGFYKNFEYHTSLSIFRNRNNFEEYLNFNLDIFNAIFDKNDANIIIDSSHYPLRALRLSHIREFELNTIYLYRNPRYVINSFSKKNIEHKYKGFWSANIYLFFVSLLSNIIYFLLPSENKIRIEYSDLVESPLVILKIICEKFGLESSDAVNLNDLKIGEIFQSNRIRNKDVIKFNTTNNSGNKRTIRSVMSAFLQFPFIIINNVFKTK